MMTLTFNGVELADGQVQGTVITGSLFVEHTHEVQVEPLISGEDSLLFDRLNRACAVEFEIQRQNGSTQRRLWQQLIGQTLPGVGVLVLTYTDENGTVHTFSCNAAKPVHSSRSVATADTPVYKFTCNRWSYSATVAEDWAGEFYGGRTVGTSPSTAVGGRLALKSIDLGHLGGRTLT